MEKKQFSKLPVAISGTKFTVTAYVGLQTLEEGVLLRDGCKPIYPEIVWWEAFIHTKEPLVYVNSKLVPRPEWATDTDEMLAKMRNPNFYDFAWFEITVAKAKFINRSIVHEFILNENGFTQYIDCQVSEFCYKCKKTRNFANTDKVKLLDILRELSKDDNEAWNRMEFLLKHKRIKFSSNNYVSYIYD